MQDRIFYRIISNAPSQEKYNTSSSTQFQRSFPLKLVHKSQEKYSLAYLSSLMQTENLLVNKLPPAQHHTTRETKIFVTEKASSLPQTGKERLPARSSHRMDAMAETRKRLLKKESALLNIVGQFDPVQHKRKETRGIEETISKARTYTVMPSRTNFMPSYKKRQNNLKMKEEFTNFVKKQDWRTDGQENQRQEKIATEPSAYEYIASRTEKLIENKIANPGDLYHFLKKENTKMKRLKTHQPTHHYPQLSKRMTEILLKSEFKTQAEPFELSKVGKRRNFQLKTQS